MAEFRKEPDPLSDGSGKRGDPFGDQREKSVDDAALPGGKVCRSGKERAGALLELVGLSHRKKSRLTELSGGEQQRVAIAIALANDPKLLLADEPTGAVDSKTTNELLRLFQQLNRELGLTVVIVTHDRLVSSFVNRAVMIRDGRTSSEFIRRPADLSGLSELSDGEEEAVPPPVEELAVVDKSGRCSCRRSIWTLWALPGRRSCGPIWRKGGSF